MRYNLYIPTKTEKEWWEKYAAKEGRSLASFIRQCVRDHIAHVKTVEKIKNKQNIDWAGPTIDYGRE